MIATDELGAMNNTAVVVNIARGTVIDQSALIAAPQDKTIGGALLDVSDPEPLPADHMLWTLDNAHVTMLLSGRVRIPG